MKVKSIISAIFCAFAFISSTVCTAQNETSKWFFGMNAGLDFMSEPPAILIGGQVFGMEGCSSISDPLGNLLFYSDGATIWNSSHLPMANGTGLFGGAGATQSSIIVKQPGNTNIYFIFTLSYNCSPALWYSVVDMNLAAGMGSVTTKNTVVFAGSCSEQLAAVKHCNGTDIWIMCHQTNTNFYRAYLINSFGVNTTAVVSSVGPVISGCSGQMKFSPNGKKLGIANSLYLLFDFDSFTGVVSNPLLLQYASNPNCVVFPYGCEFSPDGTKFYSSVFCSGLLQWDLCAGTGSAISASVFTITPIYLIGLQLGMNGKLYAARDQLSDIAVVNEPNNAGASCNFSLTGQSVFPNLCRFTFPGFMSDYFYRPKRFETTMDTTTCNTFSFYLPCRVSNDIVQSCTWDFGDLASGPGNFSNLFNPVHTYSAPGSYTAQVIINYSCRSDTIKQVLIVPVYPLLNLSGNQIICSGKSSTLQVSGADYYQWSTLANTQQIIVTPSITSSYSVSGGLVTNNCKSTAAITVSVNPLPMIAINGNTIVCETDTLTLSASGALSFTWNTGDTTSQIISIPPHIISSFSVMGADQNQCTNTVGTPVTIIANPVLSVSGNNQLCKGETTTLTALGADSYTWATFGTASDIVVSPMATTLFTLTGSTSQNACLSQYIHLVNVSDCTSIQEYENQFGSGLKIFPNPFCQSLVVSNQVMETIIIYDFLGKIIFSSNLAPGNHTIELQHLNNGVYFLHHGALEMIKLIKTDLR